MTYMVNSTTTDGRETGKETCRVTSRYPLQQQRPTSMLGYSTRELTYTRSTSTTTPRHSTSQHAPHQRLGLSIQLGQVKPIPDQTHSHPTTRSQTPQATTRPTTSSIYST